ncbi:MAG TPA: thermonuclease family protein [bacterium]|nr:thermonuclease family protein [bacterium]
MKKRNFIQLTQSLSSFLAETLGIKSRRWQGVIVSIFYAFLGVFIFTIIPFVIGFSLLGIIGTRTKNKSLKYGFSIVVILLTLLVGIPWTAAMYSPSYRANVAREADKRKDQAKAPTETAEGKKETLIQTETPKPAEVTQDQSTTTTKTYYEVVKVVDGDTLDININGTAQRIRLIGVDTPEIVDPRIPVQCFGKEASDKAKSILTGKKVAIEDDASQGDKDRYDRLLRYVYLEDGTHFNKQMISDGYAFEYTYNVPYRYQLDFKAAEKAARESSNGLWSPSTCNGDHRTATVTSSTQSTSSSSANMSTNPPKISTPVDDKDCGDFTYQEDAQEFFQANDPASDPHDLDRDHDGVACESNKHRSTAVQQTTPVPAPPTVETPAEPEPATPAQSSGVVKMSSSKICHAPGTTYYDRTTNFTPYDSIEACLAAGGRLPKN